VEHTSYEEPEFVGLRGRSHKKVASKPREQGRYDVLALLRQGAPLNDRRKVIRVPLFPCCAFVCPVSDLPLRPGDLWQP
jgi:hypothetical protein